MVGLDPTQGREQAGRRPALVVSADRFNQGPAGLVMVVPLTTRARGVPSHVLLEAGDGGVQERSYAMCENLRAIARERLIGAPFGRVSAPVLEDVADRLRLLLEL